MFRHIAIANLRPFAEFNLFGDKLIWNDTKQTEPSKEEIEAEISRLQAEYNIKEYQRLRKPEYPDLADFADAYYWAQQGDNTKMDEYLAKIQAVKDKFPKVTNAS